MGSVRSLRRARDAGVRVVFATARPWHDAYGLTRVVDPLAPVICSNGALVFRPGRSVELCRTLTLPSPVVAEVVRAVRASFPDALVGADTVRQRTVDPEWPVGWGSTPGDRAFWPMDDALPPPPQVLCLMVLGAWTAPGDVPGGWPVRVTSSHPGLLEFSAPAATKEAALRWLALREGFDLGRAVAFGDMPNDLGMLSAVGLGVAVGNAHPAVLKVADAVAGANDEDGVARFVDGLLAGGAAVPGG